MNVSGARVTCVVLGALLASACGGSGRDWVMETPEAEVSSGQLDADFDAAAVPPDVAAAQQRLSLQSENGLPRRSAPRDRTITLGETVDAAVGSERGTADGASEATDAPGTEVISVTTADTYAVPYWGWGAPYYWRGGDQSWDVGDEERDTRGSSPQVGQQWPSVPSYGPAFPFQSAPASPWGSAR